MKRQSVVANNKVWEYDSESQGTLQTERAKNMHVTRKNIPTPPPWVARAFPHLTGSPAFYSQQSGNKNRKEDPTRTFY